MLLFQIPPQDVLWRVFSFFTFSFFSFLFFSFLLCQEVMTLLFFFFFFLFHSLLALFHGRREERKISEKEQVCSAQNRTKKNYPLYKIGIQPHLFPMHLTIYLGAVHGVQNSIPPIPIYFRTNFRMWSLPWLSIDTALSFFISNLKLWFL